MNDTELTTPTDDEFLLKFLRARKFDYDRAFRLLQRYYRLRSENSELYAECYPSAILNTFENNIQTILPDFDEMGRTVFIFQAGKWDPELCSLDEVHLANQMCLEKAIQDGQTQILGIVSIIDMKSYSLQHLRNVRPSHFKKMVAVIQDSFPARFREFHIVNEPYIFEMLFTMVKPFLSEKIKNRIFFHGSNLCSLHEHIPVEILPEELGGETGKFDNSSFVKELLACDEEFQRNALFGYVKRKTSVTQPNISDRLMESIHQNLCMDEKE